MILLRCHRRPHTIDVAARRALLLTGFVFPVGVLVHWTTNNLWTLGQRLHVLRRFPPPARTVEAR
jgi:membrane protein insertase Oxa1/YidC/SpoIIIJ